MLGCWACLKQKLYLDVGNILCTWGKFTSKLLTMSLRCDKIYNFHSFRKRRNVHTIFVIIPTCMFIQHITVPQSSHIELIFLVIE